MARDRTTDFSEISGLTQDPFDDPMLTVVGFAPPADCAADRDGDAIVNTLEFLAFLNLWTAGC